MGAFCEKIYIFEHSKTKKVRKRLLTRGRGWKDIIALVVPLTMKPV